MYDLKDERGVPVSTGIPRIVTGAAIAGVVLIFIVAAIVLASSSYGHLWPADKTLNIPL